MFLSVSARSPIFPKYTSLIKNILEVTSKRAIDKIVVHSKKFAWAWRQEIFFWVPLSLVFSTNLAVKNWVLHSNKDNK